MSVGWWSTRVFCNTEKCPVCSVFFDNILAKDLWSLTCQNFDNVFTFRPKSGGEISGGLGSTQQESSSPPDVRPAAGSLSASERVPLLSLNDEQHGKLNWVRYHKPKAKCRAGSEKKMEKGFFS